MAASLVATAVASSDFTTSISVPKPTGTTNGDLMVVWIARTQAGTPEDMSASGWTQSYSTLIGNHKAQRFTRVATSSEPASWSFSAGNSADNVAIILTARNTGGTTGLHGSTQATATSTSITSPAATANGADTLPFRVFTNGKGETGTVPSGTTSLASRIQGAAGIRLVSEAAIAGGVETTAKVSTITAAEDNLGDVVLLTQPNSAPNAPIITAPANNAVLDRAVTQRFDWDFSDPDAGDSQSKYDLQYRVEGTATWTVVSGTTPNTFHDFAGGTFAAGDYEWQVRTYDAAGLVGPYSASSFFTAADAPVAPTITAPTSGGTVGPTQDVTWSYPTQAAYQVRTVADNAGAADTATIYSDTGVVESTTARSRSVSFPVNGRYEHVQVRIRDTNGLYSAYASHRVLVSYTPPAVPWARVTADSSSASIAVDVVNSTAWGYGGSGAAKNAASAALIDLAALGVARVLWLPGTAGNYVSTPDRNMLPAHADSFEDGTTGGWIGRSGAPSLANSTDFAFSGTRSLSATATATGSFSIVMGTASRVAVTAGQTYTFSGYVRMSVARSVELVVDFYDEAGAFVGDTTPLTTPSSIGTEFTRLSVTAAVPAGATRASVYIFVDDAAVAVGDVCYLDAVQVEAASSASPFTPSLRVTGDLDVRAHVALEDWTPGANSNLVGKWAGSGQAAYTLQVITTGRVRLYWSADGTNALFADSTVAPAIADGGLLHVRATLDVDNGASGRTARFFTSPDGATWTQLGSDVVQSGVTSIFANNTALHVGPLPAGEPMKGKVLSASVRAGIDGPVVAAYDATAHTDATFTDSTGKAWTVSRSGDATAEIVDRNTWAFTGSEYLTLPDRDALDVGDGDFEWAAGIATRSTSVDIIVGKKHASSDAGVGWDGYIVSGNAVEFAINNGSTARGARSGVVSLTEPVSVGGYKRGTSFGPVVNGVVGPEQATPAGSLSNTQPLLIGNRSGASLFYSGRVLWLALFRRTLTDAEHTALAAWDGSINTEPAFLRTGAALYVNAADSNQRTQYAARNLVLNLARTADEGGVASDLPVVTENRVWRSELLPSGQWSTPMRVKLGLTPDGVWVDYTPASGREYRYEVEAVGDNGTAIRSGFVT